MLSKEVTKIIETAVLNGNEVKITVEITKANSATRSRQNVNKEILEDNPFMPKRPEVRVVNESGCLIYIVAGVLSLATTIYLI